MQLLEFDEWVLRYCFKKPSSEAYDFAQGAWEYLRGKQKKSMSLYTLMRLIAGRTWKESPLSHLVKSDVIKAIDKWNIEFEELELPFRYVLGGDGMIITGEKPEDEAARKLYESQ
jgi:hypothetical protein